MPSRHPWLEAKTAAAAKKTASVSVSADAAANSGIGQSWPPCLILFSFNSHRSPLAILFVNWDCLQLLGITLATSHSFPMCTGRQKAESQ